MPDVAGEARILSQVVNGYQGIRKGVKERQTELYRAVQKTGNDGPMSGVARTYERRNEDGPQLPDEHRRVQYTAEDKLNEFLSEFTAVVDAGATLDVANTVAKADVKVGETVLLADAPAPLLLTLEKQLLDLRTFISGLPVLDPATEWTWNPDAKAFAATPTKTTKTEKVIVPVELAPATDRHPAQVQAVSKDEVIGYWSLIKFSGHMKGNDVKRLLDRVDNLLLAVKFAREEANAQTTVAPVRVGRAFANYLLS